MLTLPEVNNNVCIKTY